ncbi:hypothetical protein AB0F30_31845 [Streptomyces sp. NPDC029006]|uniref:hypothetical protein n=1 Tax=Streptomyces sp. NPDC029006 TaxID=3155467 RepID=UPI0033C57828
MADEQYRWLNRATAERLLRGESPEAVDACARDQAERLSQALGALSGLSAEAAPGTGELPGEQAALAAFRKAREAADADRTATAPASGGARASVPCADAGLVRIGAGGRTGIPFRRPRWARPVRLAVAAAVAAGTLGGVAVAAGSGVLPTPFGDGKPGPAASVSAGETSEESLAPASPQTTPDYATGPGTSPGTGTPGGGPGDRRADASGGPSGPAGGTGQSAAPGSAAPSATSGTGWAGAAAACRALRDGRELDAGRKRVLANLAGGSARVTKYCKVVLGGAGSGSGGTGGGTTTGGQGNGNGNGNGAGSGGDKGGDKGSGGDKDKDGDQGHGKGDGGGKGHGNGHGNGDGGGKGHGKGDGRGKSGGKGHGAGAGGAGGAGGGKGVRHRGGAVPAPSGHAPAHPGGPGSAPAAPSPTATYTAL